MGWSALHAVKTKGPLQDFYEGLVKRGVSKSTSLVAVAAKILRRCFYLLRDGVEFDPSRLQRRDPNTMQNQLKVVPIQA